MNFDNRMEFQKCFYPTKSTIVKAVDAKPRKGFSRVRRNYRSEENIQCHKRSNSTAEASFSLISCKNSESHFFIPTRDGLVKVKANIRNTIRSNSSNNLEMIRADFNNRTSMAGKSQQKSIETKHIAFFPISESSLKTKPHNGKETKNKVNQCSDNKTLYDDQERLRNEFVILENCFGELLVNNDVNSSKTARNFSKLLLSVYRLTQEVRKKFFKEKEVVNDNKTVNPLSATGLTDFSDVSSLDIFTEKSNKAFEINCNSNDMRSKNSKLDVERAKKKTEKTSTDFVNNDQFDNVINPLKLDNDKLQLGQLLKTSNIKIRSTSVLRTYENFVEEQYLLTALREVSKEERMVLDKMVGKKQVHADEKFESRCTCRLHGDKAFVDEAVQTTANVDRNIDGVSNGKCRNAYAQTGYIPYSASSIESMDENTETCFQIDNLSDDGLNFQVENRAASVSFKESSTTYIAGSEQEFARCVMSERTCNTYLLISDKEYHVTLTMLFVQWCDIDINIPEHSLWTVYGSKVKCVYSYAIQHEIIPKVALIDTIAYDAETLNNGKRPSEYVTNDINLTNKTEQNISGPPCSLSSITKTKDVDWFLDVRGNNESFGLSTERNIPSPGSLNRLYDRLTKLQEMLECIPGENHTEYVAKNRSPRNSGSRITQVCPTSVGDCSVGDGASDNFGRPKTLLKTESQPQSRKKSKLKSSPEYLDESLLDVDKSDATTSLSILENLIDDFLTKNGLKKFADV